MGQIKLTGILYTTDRLVDWMSEELLNLQKGKPIACSMWTETKRVEYFVQNG